MEKRKPVSSFLILPVVRIGSDGTTDRVVVEEPLEILINGRNFAITMRTPGHDEELAAGFLFTEGLIKAASQILSVTGAGNQVNVELANPPNTAPRLVMTSACGVCGKSSIDELYAAGCKALPQGTFRIKAETLRTLPAIFKASQSVFHQTGGLHAAGLFDAEGRLELIREDVGRHNAVDKLIGARLICHESLAAAPQPTRMLLVSGRASFELVQKAAMAGIPMLAAVGAPSTLAVETAHRFNMTLAGFLRDDRFNIYAGPERILQDPLPC
jgi:FdhD protein